MCRDSFRDVAMATDLGQNLRNDHYSGPIFFDLVFSRIIGNHVCTPCENVVRFGLVTGVLGERSCTAGVDNCYHA